MKKNRAQALVLTLLIVLTLTVLAINTAHTVSIGLSLVNYSRYRLGAFSNAKSALSMGIRRIMEDPYAAVRADEKSWTVVDEESRINLNKAGRELLVALLEEYAVSQPEETADAIIIWRGDRPDTEGVYKAAGYPCKGSRFSVVEELTCVPGLSRQSIEPLREAVTLYGTGDFNLNTVSERTLAVICRGYAKKLGIDEQFADSARDRLIKAREGAGYLKNTADLKLSPTGQEESAIINAALKNAVCTSDNFSIEARGIVSKIAYTIKAVYDRKTNRLIGWHES